MHLKRSVKPWNFSLFHTTNILSLPGSDAEKAPIASEALP